MYDSYKRIKFCVSQKNARLMPDLEQAYLSLITASRGCTSVQRVVADLIPRYAFYCPTALEAAAKVAINMHNWSMTVINRGEDVDGVAFQTAKACIFGLADICHTASSEAPTSSVIQGICSAVFLNVISFFISSFDGQDIFQIIDKDILKMQDSPEFFSEFKQKFSDEDGSVSLKLTKFRALSLLWIFFCCPRNSLAACFELFNSTSKEGCGSGGHYFLSQVTSRLDTSNVADHLDSNSNRGTFSTGCMESSSKLKEVNGDELVSDDNHVPKDASPVSRNCLLGLVLGKDQSLRRWIFVRYKKLCKSSSPQVVSEITSALEGVFESFTKQVEAEDSPTESDEDDPNPSKYISRQYLVPRISNKHKTSSEASGRDGSYHDVVADKFSGKHLERRSSIGSLETDVRSNTSSNIDSGGPRSNDFDSGDHGDFSRARSSTPRDLLNNQMLSPMTRKPLELRSNSFEGRSHFVHIEKNHVTKLDSQPAFSSSGGGVNAFESPRHHLRAPYPTKSPVIWFSDGDQAAMDIFSASRQLWLGSLGPDTSEALVRFQFEKFGPIDKFLYFPFKGFALIEYKDIMDALKAREVMRGRSPWGACLHIKFLDVGLGTKGDRNGVAVGSSSHLYVGNVLSQGLKDEILHELTKVLYKGPLMVNDLTSEGALLMEFETPEQAATVMAHLRQCRKDNNLQPSNVGQANFMMSAERARHGSTSMHIDMRNNNSGNSIVSSPHAQLEFSHPGKHHSTPLIVKPAGNTMELTSPRINSVNQRNPIQGGHAFQSKWMAFGSTGMPEAGARNFDANVAVDSSQGGGHVVSAAPEQMWMYGKPEIEQHSASGSISCIPAPAQGHNIAPPQLLQASPFMRPIYFPPHNAWDARGFSHQMPLSPIPPGVMPSNLHNHVVAPPFLPASVTPLAQMQGSSMPQFDQMFSLPVPPPQPDLAPPLPPQPDLPPPLPSSPPPLPEAQPPLVPPPPPSSPPLAHPIEPSSIESSRHNLPYQWQGTLSKSGVHYCTIYAHRLHSDICKYSNAISEPAEWPTKLDMTKRTDFRHVKSTFSSTPPHKREVCQLLPSSAGDHKGFQDFISYLKQRECAGVIKIPAVKSVWARLLFILPYSHDICSTLSIAPNQSDCLIALILPKETNFEWV